MNTYLPEWAERKAVGTELCIGRQLATRDGRKLGNAVITGFESKTYANDPARYVLYHVRTDAGNVCKMSEAEVNECYYLGDYIMKSVARAIPQDAPAGNGWVMASVHDTEDDGPVCVWLRKIITLEPGDLVDMLTDAYLAGFDESRYTPNPWGSAINFAQCKVSAYMKDHNL